MSVRKRAKTATKKSRPMPAPASAGDVGTLERSFWPAELSRELLTGKWNIGFQMRDIHRMFRKEVKERVGAHGVAVSMWTYLWALYMENGLTQNELARRVRLVGPSVVAALNQMEKAGLVRRQRSTTDRRVVHVFLTERGEATRKGLMDITCEINTKALRHLTSSEISQLFFLLDRVRQGLNGEPQ
jgi:DNA-binding MarR family transcriptional regulator